jgi:hypothetical protein
MYYVDSLDWAAGSQQVRGRFFCREPAKLRSRQGWTLTLMGTAGHGSGQGSGSGTAQDELWLKNRPLNRVKPSTRQNVMVSSASYRDKFKRWCTCIYFETKNWHINNNKSTVMWPEWSRWTLKNYNSIHFFCIVCGFKNILIYDVIKLGRDSTIVLQFFYHFSIFFLNRF